MFALFAFVALPLSAVATTYLDYWNANRSDQSGGLVFSYDKWRYEIGDTMNVVYTLRPGRLDAQDLTLQMFSVNRAELTPEQVSYYYDGRNTQFCDVISDYPPGSKLLYEQHLGNVPANTNVGGQLSLNLTASNGFTIAGSKNDSGSQESFIFARVVDPQHTIWPFEDAGLEFCQSELLQPMIHEQKEYPDFAVSNIVIEPNNARPNDRVTMSFTISNRGAAFETTADDPLLICLDKRNIGLPHPNNPNLVVPINSGVNFLTAIDPDGFCDSITSLDAGESIRRRHAITLNSSNLDTTFRDMATDNDDFTCGSNRIVWEANSNKNHIEETYENNDSIYNLELCEEPTTETTPVTPPKTSEVKQTNSVKKVANTPPAGVRILKSPIHAAVYWVENGVRHAFPNRTVYATWFPNFAHLENVSADAVEAIRLGPPVSVKPGAALLKFPYNPNVYEVKENKVLSHIPNEATARARYGASWAHKIITLPEIFSLFYTR